MFYNHRKHREERQGARGIAGARKHRGIAGASKHRGIAGAGRKGHSQNNRCRRKGRVQ